MDFNIMVIFDIIVGILGAYLLVKGIIGKKKHEVDPMLITAEELSKCIDKQGLADFLMPKAAIFGAYCLICGIEGICYDMQLVAIPYGVNAVVLIVFIIVWALFSYSIKQAKTKFIRG